MKEETKKQNRVAISTFKSGKAEGKIYGQFNYKNKDYINLCLCNIESVNGRSMFDDEGRHGSISWTLPTVKRVLREAFNLYSTFERNAAGMINIKVCSLNDCEKVGLVTQPKDGVTLVSLNTITPDKIMDIDDFVGQGRLTPQYRLLRKDSDYFKDMSQEDFDAYCEKRCVKEVDRETGEVLGYKKINLLTGEISIGDLGENECRYSYDCVYVKDDDFTPNLWVGLGSADDNFTFGEMVKAHNTTAKKVVVKEQTNVVEVTEDDPNMNE